MEAVIFIGIQAAGKSTFYRERFFNTHIRINLDMLRTRHRETQLVQACIAAKQSFVIDNTNPTALERARYIGPAQKAGFEIVGYYFQSKIEACKSRNQARAPGQMVPISGLLSTYGKLEMPTHDEGFERLYYVSIDENGGFSVEEWNDEI
jgi:predicted kinase